MISVATVGKRVIEEVHPLVSGRNPALPTIIHVLTVEYKTILTTCAGTRTNFVANKIKHLLMQWTMTSVKAQCSMPYVPYPHSVNIEVIEPST